eukprot:2492294-Pleurochrysis_carterae.AAC.1
MSAARACATRWGEGTALQALRTSAAYAATRDSPGHGDDAHAHMPCSHGARARAYGMHIVTWREEGGWATGAHACRGRLRYARSRARCG